MILIYSSNHMRMWHHLVLALNWSFFDSEGWMMNTHTFISGRGKFQSLDRKMLAVHDWGHRVQWVSPRVSLFIRRLYEPCVCCAVDNTSPGRRRWMGRSRGRGVRAWHGSGATHGTPMSHSHPDFFLNETHCSLSRIWNLSWLSVFRYWYVVADCMTVFTDHIFWSTGFFQQSTLLCFKPVADGPLITTKPIENQKGNWVFFSSHGNCQIFRF